MPTYDYECGACKHAFELFQSIKARPIRKCPSCGRQAAKRLIGTGGGVIFRGSGFYQTDYRSESYKQAAKSETDGGSKTKTETKAEKAVPSTPKPDTKGKAADAGK